MRTRNVAIAVLTGATACCVLTGCYDPNEIKDFLLKPRAPVSGTEYRVLPPDVITITSRQVPEIASVTQRIRPDGKINLPLLGEVYVANMTPREIEETLKKKASKYYEQVDATVTVSAYLSQAFYVFGQVNRQGPQPWTGRDTLLDALARAGPNRLAWYERVTVVRGADPKEGGYAVEKPSLRYRLTGVHPSRKDKPRKKMTINVLAMFQSGDMANNILLQPNDVVYVQPTPWARLGLAIQNLLFPVQPIMSTVSIPARAATAATVP